MPFLQNLSAPKFGCRLSVYMNNGSVSPTIAQDVIENALIQNPNSLKVQAAKRPNGNPVADQFVCTGQDEVALRAMEGNADGWGMVTTDSKGQWSTPAISLLSADTDASFNAATKELSEQQAPQKGKTILAHLLKSPSDRAPTTFNLHPFKVGGWVGMLNGGMRGFLKEMRERVESLFTPLLGQAIKGTTAGELGLHYFVGKLKEQYGTDNFGQIGSDRVRETFESVITEIRQKALATQDKMLPGKKVGLNFVMSDGDHTMGYRYGRSLFVGTRSNPATGKIQEAFLTSEPLKKEGAVAGFQWREVPESSFVYLDRIQENGSSHLKVEIKPHRQI